MLRRAGTIWISIGLIIALGMIAIWSHSHSWVSRSLTIQGAVIRSSDDLHKEVPVSGATVTSSDGSITTSDAAGYFVLRLNAGAWSNRSVYVHFRRDGYRPIDLSFSPEYLRSDKQLHVVAMESIPEDNPAAPHTPPSVVSNIRIRYTQNSEAEENIGSVVKTFEVANKGNLACKHSPLCSPDGTWKANSNSLTLDAGAGNEFRDARASCIAGPCPFTRIDSSGLAHDGRYISVSAEDWSETATFLLEAEVFHASISSNVRVSYPVFFGRTIYFSLSPSQEGVSIEADIDQAPMVFPLGPDLYLSWATCTAEVNKGPQHTTVYHCELKPGYSL